MAILEIRAKSTTVAQEWASVKNCWKDGDEILLLGDSSIAHLRGAGEDTLAKYHMANCGMSGSSALEWWLLLKKIQKSKHKPKFIFVSVAYPQNYFLNDSRAWKQFVPYLIENEEIFFLLKERLVSLQFIPNIFLAKISSAYHMNWLLSFEFYSLFIKNFNIFNITEPISYSKEQKNFHENTNYDPKIFPYWELLQKEKPIIFALSPVEEFLLKEKGHLQNVNEFLNNCNAKKLFCVNLETLFLKNSAMDNKSNAHIQRKYAGAYFEKIYETIQQSFKLCDDDSGKGVGQVGKESRTPSHK